MEHFVAVFKLDLTAETRTQLQEEGGNLRHICSYLPYRTVEYGYLYSAQRKWVRVRVCHLRCATCVAPFALRRLHCAEYRKPWNMTRALADQRTMTVAFHDDKTAVTSKIKISHKSYKNI